MKCRVKLISPSSSEQYLIRHDHRDIPQDTNAGLEALGYEVEPNSWGDLGDIQAIQQIGPIVQAVSDNRGRGVALVFEIE